MILVVCHREPNGNVATRECASWASALGVIAHLVEDYRQIWVRENPGGAIVLVYNAHGAGLQRP